jgi:hypothetical protein
MADGLRSVAAVHRHGSIPIVATESQSTPDRTTRARFGANGVSENRGDANGKRSEPGANGVSENRGDANGERSEPGANGVSENRGDANGEQSEP